MADTTGVRVITKKEFRDRVVQRKTEKPRKRLDKFVTKLDPSRVELVDRASISLRYEDKDFFALLGDGSVSKGVRVAADLARGKLNEISQMVLAAKAIKYGREK